MPYNKYLQISREQYDDLCRRSEKFSKCLDDVNTVPVKMFDGLSEKQMQELFLIREASKELQEKRDEDIRKAAQLAAEAEKLAKEAEAAAKEAEAAAKEAENAGQEAQAATEATPAKA